MLGIAAKDFACRERGSNTRPYASSDVLQAYALPIELSRRGGFDLASQTVRRRQFLVQSTASRSGEAVDRPRETQAHSDRTKFTSIQDERSDKRSLQGMRSTRPARRSGRRDGRREGSACRLTPHSAPDDDTHRRSDEAPRVLLCQRIESPRTYSDRSAAQSRDTA